MNKYKLTRKEVIECMEDYGVLEWNPEIYGILVNALLAKKEPKEIKCDCYCHERESKLNPCPLCGCPHASIQEQVEEVIKKQALGGYFSIWDLTKSVSDLAQSLLDTFEIKSK